MTNGTFAWFEYVATDVQKALNFYGETIGWSLAKTMGPYQMLSVGELPVGGVVPHGANGAGKPGSYWLSYISTDDVDATVARAVELGGEVVKAAYDVPEVGRMAVVRDPQGGLFAPYRADSPGERPEPGAEGAFGWSEFCASDADAAFEYYSALFGWEAAGSKDGEYQMFGASDDPSAAFGGVFEGPEEAPKGWVYYTNTADLDAAIVRIERNGGKLVNGPTALPGGRLAGFIDPQGAAFALHQSIPDR